MSVFFSHLPLKQPHLIVSSSSTAELYFFARSFFRTFSSTLLAETHILLLNFSLTNEPFSTGILNHFKLTKHSLSTLDELAQRIKSESFDPDEAKRRSILSPKVRNGSYLHRPACSLGGSSLSSSSRRRASAG